jgi:SAM-dependent methyltransferase
MSTTEANRPTMLYEDLAHWWPLVSAPKDYEPDAAFYSLAIVEASESEPRTVLELGSGGGNNASHMKNHFDLTLVDASPAMVEVSRALNPECAHQVGDMRTVRLDREFDAVFLHDAISYMTSESDLRAAVATAFVHCKPGGVAVFAPDFVRETFRSGADHGGHDGDGRSMRYFEWIHDPDPSDTEYTVDYAFLIRENGEPVRVVPDSHTLGLFARGEWLEFLRDAGFEAESMPYPDTIEEAAGREMFLATRPVG